MTWGTRAREGSDIDGVRDRRRADSRARTIDVALRLFVERGYDAVTVADICAAADIAPRTFFRYFPAKEDVLAEPVRELSDRMTGYLAEAPAGLDDAAALRAAVRRLGEHVVADRARFTRFFRAAREASALRTHPAARLADRELDLVEGLARRAGRPVAPPGDWRTRLVVARTTAAFRIWLDDLVAADGAAHEGAAHEGVATDPLAHLDEVLAAS